MIASGGAASFDNCVGAGAFFWRATLASDPGVTATAGFEVALTEPGTARPLEGASDIHLTSAHALGDGRILVTEPVDSEAFDSPLQLRYFEPWCETVSSPIATVESFGGYLTLADGRVLVGGDHVLDPETADLAAVAADLSSAERFVVLGDGRVAFNRDETIWIWDPVADQAAPVADVPPVSIDGGFSRYLSAGAGLALLPGGEVLIAGGLVTESFSNGHTTVWIFDPRTETTRVADEPMNTGRHSLELYRLDGGRIAAVGGSSYIIAGLLVDVYDPATGVWTARGQFPNFESGLDSGPFATLEVDDRIFAIGGRDHDGYKPMVSSWTPSGEISIDGVIDTARAWSSPVGRTGAAALPGGRVLVVGGFDDDFDTRRIPAEIYRP
jgi:hypothetical protein